MGMDWQWMRHPQTGGVQRFAATAAEAWRGAGWQPCDEPPAENLAVVPSRPPTETPTPVEPPADPVKSSRRASADTRRE